MHLKKHWEGFHDEVLSVRMTVVPKGFGFGLAAGYRWAVAYSPQGEGGGANDGSLGEWVGCFSHSKVRAGRTCALGRAGGVRRSKWRGH